MKKFALLGLVVLAGSLFSGCLMADLAPSSLPDKEECITTCSAQAGTGSGYVDQTMGTEGPPGYFFPGEHGEYWWAQKELGDTGETPTEGCTRFPGTGGGGGGDANRIDTYRNDSSQGLAPQGFGGVVGCPPNYICGWQGPHAGYGACEPPFVDDVHLSLCNVHNGACDDPALPFFWGATAPDPGPGYLADDGTHTVLQYISLDSAYGATTGGPCGFGDNLLRREGSPCIDCGSGGPAPTPGDDHKIDICHIPRGNPDNAHTISIDVAAWPAHEAHGDTQGPCGGGPVGEGGLEKQNLNIAPDWVLAVCWYVPLPERRLIDGLPWEDDYNGGISQYAAQKLIDIVNNHEVNEQGLATLPITRITANGSELVFDPAFEIQLGLEVVSGQMASRWAIGTQQDGLRDFVQFLMANTPHARAVDMTSFKMELSSGLVLDGGTMASAFGFTPSFNHDRLGRFLEDLRGASTTMTPRLEARTAVR